MDRPIAYSLEQIRSFDTLWGYEYNVIGAGNINQMILGSNGTYVQDIVATATAPASLTINLTTGFITQLAPVDATAYGSLSANSQQIMQQGPSIITSVDVTPYVAAIGSGQQRYVLIQAGYKQIDSIAPGDPNGGVLPYININNPTQPFYGPNNSGVPQNTLRQAICDVNVIPGSVATTGTEVPPDPSSGYVPLYLIDLYQNQTQVTNMNILPAGPVATAPSYPVAPWLAGLLNSHHDGAPGQAPQIILTTGDTCEVQGHLGVDHMVASNSTGAVAAFKTYAGNPNTHLAGNANVNGASDLCWDSVGLVLYICSATGTSTTAVWTAAGGGGGGGAFTSTALRGFTSSGSYTPTAGTAYIVVYAVGGGGGGGGGDSNIFSSQSAAGGGAGGGGGGLAVFASPASALSFPVSITIGTGGAGGGAGNGNTHSHVAATSGGNGGTTYFGSYSYAQGGNGGGPGYGGAAGGTSASGSVGVLDGYVISGTAGTNTGVDNAGAGGASGWGSGGGRGGSTGAVATAGQVAGGGGGGGYSTSHAGAAGGNGLVIIQEFIS